MDKRGVNRVVADREKLYGGPWCMSGERVVRGNGHGGVYTGGLFLWVRLLCKSCTGNELKEEEEDNIYNWFITH